MWPVRDARGGHGPGMPINETTWADSERAMSFTGNSRAPDPYFTGSGRPLEAREQKTIPEYVIKSGSMDRK